MGCKTSTDKSKRRNNHNSQPFSHTITEELKTENVLTSRNSFNENPRFYITLNKYKINENQQIKNERVIISSLKSSENFKKIIQKDIYNLKALSDQRIIYSDKTNAIKILSHDLFNKTWKLDINIPHAHKNLITNICEVNRKITILTSSNDQTFKIWKIYYNNVDLLEKIKSEFTNVFHIISLDNNYKVASSSKTRNNISIWKCRNPFQIECVITSDNPVIKLYKMKTYNYLIGACESYAQVWDLSTKNLIQSKIDIRLYISNYVELPNGFLAVSNFSQIKIVDVVNNIIVAIINDDENCFVTGYHKNIQGVSGIFLLDMYSLIYTYNDFLIQISIKDNEYEIIYKRKFEGLSDCRHINVEQQFMLFYDGLVVYYSVKSYEI